MALPIDRPLDTTTTITDSHRPEGAPRDDRATRSAARPDAGDHFVRSTAADNAFYALLDRILGGVEVKPDAADPAAYFKSLFAALANNPEAFYAVLERVFGADIDRGTATTILLESAAGNFDWLPEVRLVGADVLGSRNGAYDKANGVIYLRADLSRAQAAATFMEEVGHHLDHRLNGRDTAGDEGEHFRRLLFGEDLTRAEIRSIGEQHDKGEIKVGDRTLQVEFDESDDPGPEEPRRFFRSGSFLDRPSVGRWKEVEAIFGEFMARAAEEFKSSPNPQIGRTAQEAMGWVQANEQMLRELGLYDAALASAQKAVTGAAAGDLEQFSNGVGGVAVFRVMTDSIQTDDPWMATAQLTAALAMSRIQNSTVGTQEEKTSALVAVGTLAAAGSVIGEWAIDHDAAAGAGVQAAGGAETGGGTSFTDVLSALGFATSTAAAIAGGIDFGVTVTGATLRGAARAGIAGALLAGGMTAAGVVNSGVQGGLTPGQATLSTISFGSSVLGIAFGLGALAGGPVGLTIAAAIVGGIGFAADITNIVISNRGGGSTTDVPGVSDAGDGSDGAEGSEEGDGPGGEDPADKYENAPTISIDIDVGTGTSGDVGDSGADDASDDDSGEADPV